MKKATLGRTGMTITPLIYGTLPIGPLQAGLTAQEGARLIRHALEAGVDMLDTAELYGTYPHIRLALEGFSGQVRIATKTHAPTAELARQHVEKGLKALGLERFDVVHLHGANVAKPFTERAGVLDTLCALRDEGKIAHVGISTHFTSVVADAARHEQIEVIHPLTNRKGLGLRDGSAGQMAAAVLEASRAGKGIYGMKALAGGNLIDEARQAIKYVVDMEGMDALALGMLSEAEIDANLALVTGGPVDDEEWERLSSRERTIRIMSIVCKGCGECCDACPAKAMTIKDNLARVDSDKCILCGYCASACPDFAIRIN